MDIKIQTKISVLLEKINYLQQSIAQNGGVVNKVDKDLLVNYVRELYELSLSIPIQNQQAPQQYLSNHIYLNRIPILLIRISSRIIRHLIINRKIFHLIRVLVISINHLNNLISHRNINHLNNRLQIMAVTQQLTLKVRVLKRTEILMVMVTETVLH